MSAMSDDELEKQLIKEYDNHVIAEIANRGAFYSSYNGDVYTIVKNGQSFEAWKGNDHSVICVADTPYEVFSDLF